MRESKTKRGVFPEVKSLVDSKPMFDKKFRKTPSVPPGSFFKKKRTAAISTRGWFVMLSSAAISMAYLLAQLLSSAGD